MVIDRGKPRGWSRPCPRRTVLLVEGKTTHASWRPLTKKKKQKKKKKRERRAHDRSDHRPCSRDVDHAGPQRVTIIGSVRSLPPVVTFKPFFAPDVLLVKSGITPTSSLHHRSPTLQDRFRAFAVSNSAVAASSAVNRRPRCYSAPSSNAPCPFVVSTVPRTRDERIASSPVGRYPTQSFSPQTRSCSAARGSLPTAHLDLRLHAEARPELRNGLRRSGAGG